MDFATQIQICRQRLSDPSVNRTNPVASFLRLISEPMQIPSLVKTGTAVWAAIAQANDKLFQPRGADLPALVVYSFDPVFDAKPDALAQIARKCFALKNTRPSDSDRANIAALMTNEYSKPNHVPIPPALASQRACFISRSIIHRRHLPTGRLSQGFFPYLINRQSPKNRLILPLRFWSPELAAAWKMAER